jgi:hypothetical protein
MRLLRLLSVGLLATALSTITFAQAQAEKGADRQQSESTITGCLSKDAAGGGFVIADEKTGAKTPVAGSADLEKHSANHKVTLTGTKSDVGGKSTFQVTKIQHVSPECKAPSN